MPAVTGVVLGAEVAEVAVGFIGEEAVVVEPVAGHPVAPGIEEAQPWRGGTTFAIGDRRGCVRRWERPGPGSPPPPFCCPGVFPLCRGPAPPPPSPPPPRRPPPPPPPAPSSYLFL